jgi:hypothetical protein
MSIAAAAAAVACASCVAVSGSDAKPLSAQAACGGRALLTCAEQSQSFPDAVNWAHGFVLDAELFETPLAARIHTPALKQFWLFEAATAAARAEYEFAFGSEITDQNFEEVFQPPKLPKPVVHKGRVVSRKLAAALTALMQAEQAEVLNLYAVDVALNRATEARYLRGREDWVKWQEATAAGYARRTAATIGGVIRAQRRASRGLLRSHLPFGVGSADLNLAHRNVRKYGLARSMVSLMHSFGFDSSLVSHIAQYFRQTSFGSLSFSLSEFLGAAQQISGESEFRSALTHFADRVPPAVRPPS